MFQCPAALLCGRVSFTYCSSLYHCKDREDTTSVSNNCVIVCPAFDYSIIGKGMPVTAGFGFDSKRHGKNHFALR